MTLLLNEYIRNVEHIRLKKGNKLKCGIYESCGGDTIVRNSGKIFTTSSNPDESALWSIMRVVTEKSSMGVEEMKRRFKLIRMVYNIDEDLLVLFKSGSSDKTPDGLLDKQNFNICTESLGISTFVKDQLFRVFNHNRDGLMDLQEFSIG